MAHRYASRNQTCVTLLEYQNELSSFRAVIFRRFISLATVIALIAVIFLPSELVCCGKENADAAVRACCVDDLACCACNHPSAPAQGESGTSQFIPSGPLCACPVAVPAPAEIPLRVEFVSQVGTASILPGAISIWYCTIDCAGTPLRAIDTSPPHLAARGQDTFLRTSSLLI